MDALVAGSVYGIGSQVCPGMEIHPCTIAYIQSLVRPYAEALKPADSVGGIVQWIPLVFQDDSEKLVQLKMIRRVRRELVKLGQDHNLVTDNDPISLRCSKDSIIEYLLAKILELSGHMACDMNDHVVFPWDVQQAIYQDEHLSQMFRITPDDKLLPISVVVCTDKILHMLSEEFVAGLLVFSDIVKHNFHVSFNDIEINYLTKPKGNRFIKGASPERYTVDVCDKIYTFNSSDFMQGFATGALWANVDHHNYWKDLRDYKESEEGVQMTF